MTKSMENITIVRSMAVSLMLSLICMTAVLAHEGRTHVMGTVSALDGQHVVVTDREGKTISIALTQGTTYVQGEAPSAASALQVGRRVVVDVTGKPDSFSASEIRIAPAAPASGHQGAEGEHGQPHQH